MPASRSVTRRRFVSTALAAAGATGPASGSWAAESRRSKPPSGRDGRGVVIRDAYVLTMDPGLGDLDGGDVYVRDGVIVDVGKRLRPTGAHYVDGHGTIVMPGLVETHWHLWTGLFRSLAGDTPDRAYFPLSQALGRAYTADDLALGTLLSAAEAIHGGITFVHDWCHNVHGPEFAEAALRALRRSGLRARFSYGKPNWAPVDTAIDLDDLRRLHADWDRYSRDGLLSLGMAWTGRVSFGTPRPEAVYRAEFAAAAELGIPMTIHLFAGGVADLDSHGLLVPGMQVVHAVGAGPDEIAAMATHDLQLSVSPYTELRIGFGFPRVSDFLAAGIPVGLSVDTTALSGNADLFAIMKAIQNIENGLARDEFAFPARRALELATTDGAKSMGMADAIGSLTPGKRADLIIVRTDAVNVGPFTDAAHLVVEAVQPANVDLVMVDGRVLKWQGRLVDLDGSRLVADGARALARIRAQAGV